MFTAIIPVFSYEFIYDLEFDLYVSVYIKSKENLFAAFRSWTVESTSSLVSLRTLNCSSIKVLESAVSFRHINEFDKHSHCCWRSTLVLLLFQLQSQAHTLEHPKDRLCCLGKVLASDVGQWKGPLQ